MLGRGIEVYRYGEITPSTVGSFESIVQKASSALYKLLIMVGCVLGRDSLKEQSQLKRRRKKRRKKVLCQGPTGVCRDPRSWHMVG